MKKIILQIENIEADELFSRLERLERAIGELRTAPQEENQNAPLNTLQEKALLRFSA